MWWRFFVVVGIRKSLNFIDIIIGSGRRGIIYVYWYVCFIRKEIVIFIWKFYFNFFIKLKKVFDLLN